MISSLISYYNDFWIQMYQLLPKISGAFLIIAVGFLVSRLIYLILKFFLKKIKLNHLVDKFQVVKESQIDEKLEDLQDAKNKKLKKLQFTKKIEPDIVVAKSISYYIFILFFRLSINYLGITEVEAFLKDLTYYLPNLFVGILIGFFGIRFANFIYELVYHTLSVTREEKVNKVIASGAKIIILFFTFMLVLDYTKIVNEVILNTILIGFISMLAIAGGLAFGLGGKDVAKDILESFRK